MYAIAGINVREEGRRYKLNLRSLQKYGTVSPIV